MNKTMSDNEQSQNNLYGVIIKVENLNACRSFYRDILNLGAPVMDSNFWVEFKLNDSSSLILQQAVTGETLPAGRGRIAWMCNVENIEETLARLDKNGYKPIAEEEELIGVKVFNFCDPEGTPFSICEKKNA
jgi:predicted enzyme related to lactoylglutathione lyase